MSLSKEFLFNSEYSTFCWANQYDVDPICEGLAGMPESKENLFSGRIKTGRVPATPELFISSFSVLVGKPLSDLSLTSRGQQRTVGNNPTGAKLDPSHHPLIGHEKRHHMHYTCHSRSDLTLPSDFNRK